jgi:hypothetical protein
MSDAPEFGGNDAERALAGLSPERLPTGFQRALGAARMALPLVQRILPLFDGNIGSAVSNFLPREASTHPPPPTVNLDPIENRLIDLQNRHRELQRLMMEQTSKLRGIEDRLEELRDDAARNAQAQDELHEDMKAVSARIKIFAGLILAFLGLSSLMNVVFYLQMRHILP